MDNKKQIWFPAKRFGWGWGLPITWQGWAVTTAFITLVIAGPFVLPQGLSGAIYVGYYIVLGVAFFVVCWRKGEPPAWRWGRK